MFIQTSTALTVLAGALSVLARSLPALQARGPIQLPPNCDRFYIVELGDNCNTIAAQQNVSTYQLATVNNATIDANCDNLAEGEPICLGLTGQDCSTVHVMVAGDGCDTISAAAGIPESTLFANNPNINAGCTNIYPGEVFCTASEIYPYGETSA